MNSNVQKQSFEDTSTKYNHAGHESHAQYTNEDNTADYMETDVQVAGSHTAPDYSNLKQTAKVTQGKNKFPPATLGDLRRNPQRHSEKCVKLLEEYNACRRNIFNSFIGKCQKPFKMVNDCLGEEFEFHRQQNRLKGRNTRVLLDTLREQRKEQRWKELARQGEEVVSWNSMSEELLMNSKRSQLRQEYEYFSHDDIKGYDWNKYVENLDKMDETFQKEYEGKNV